MTNVPRQALIDIIAKYGTDLCSNSQRCEGLLRDRCGSYRREINILINALEEHIPLELLSKQNSVPHELLLLNLSKRLEENLAITENAASWAVETWALALNVISIQELIQRENKRNKSFTDNKTNLDSALNPKNDERLKADESLSTETDLLEQTQKSNNNKNQSTNSAPADQPLSASINVDTQTPQAQNFPVPISNTQTQINQSQTSKQPTYPIKKRSGKLRGCFIGCFLLLILLLVLIFGVPYTFRIMRETQQTGEPPRLPPR